MKRLDLFEVNRRLLEKKVKLKGSYISAKIPTICECINCSYEWGIRPDDIFHNKGGCPQCSNKIRITDEVFDARIRELPIKRVGHCVNNSTPISVQCLKKNYGWNWNTAPTNIINKGHGCPMCSTAE